GVADPAEAPAESVIVEWHVDHAACAQAVEQSLQVGLVVAFDPMRDRRRESPLMSDRAVGTAELAAGETEPGDLDGAFGSDVVGPVMIGSDQLEVVEHVSVQI